MSGGQCCENPPTLSSSSGTGLVQQFGGLTSYISGPHHSKAATILISDIFGYEAPKLRKIAVKVGAAGFYTVVPDFMHGDPYDPVQKTIPEWIKNHGTDQGFEESKAVIEALKSKGVTKIGGVGFCWGAKVVVELAKHAYIDAGVLLHPFIVTCEDVQGVKVPLSILGAEVDELCPPELVKQFKDILTAKLEVDSFVKIFRGVSHGWSVRYKDEDEDEDEIKSTRTCWIGLLSMLSELYLVKYISCDHTTKF